MLRYSILFYLIYLAFVDVYLAEKADLCGPISRWTLWLLSVSFVIATFYKMIKSIYDTSRTICSAQGDKQVTDVLNDLSLKQTLTNV